MADYNIIQITPEKVEQACMQTKPKPTHSMPTPTIITPEKMEQSTSSSHRPNTCPPSNITTINPPCKSEQNIVSLDLVQLRQVLNQVQKDVTDRLKVYATLENLKEEAETRYSEDQILADKLKQLEELTWTVLEDIAKESTVIGQSQDVINTVNAQAQALSQQILDNTNGVAQEVTNNKILNELSLLAAVVKDIEENAALYHYDECSIDDINNMFKTQEQNGYMAIPYNVISSDGTMPIYVFETLTDYTLY